MFINDYLSDTFIGQENLKSRINFYIESHRKTNIFKNLLISSPRGVGKTELMTQIAKNLLMPDGRQKNAFIINGATLKNVSGFVNNIVIPHISNNQYVTIAIDEIHAVEESVIAWLLTILGHTNNFITQNSYDGVDYFFDYRYFSFLAATTNIERLPLAFSSRLKRIEFEPYKEKELTIILYKNSPLIKYQDNIEKQIVSVVRGLPRYVVDIAKDIEKFCNLKGNEIFDKNDWLEFKKIHHIRPLGITNKEYELLEYLSEHEGRTLTCLAAKLGLDTTTVRRDIESYLISHSLIEIMTKRYITGYGLNILRQCDKE
mgnify:CR=1 FL=1